MKLVVNEANGDWDLGFMCGLNDARNGNGSNPKLAFDAPPNNGAGNFEDFSFGYLSGRGFDNIKAYRKMSEAVSGTYLGRKMVEAAKEGLRLAGKNGQTIVLNPTKTEDGEFQVKVMINGKKDEDKTYYTNDWDDAVATAKRMAESIGDPFRTTPDLTKPVSGDLVDYGDYMGHVEGILMSYGDTFEVSTDHGRVKVISAGMPGVWRPDPESFQESRLREAGQCALCHSNIAAELRTEDGSPAYCHECATIREDISTEGTYVWGVFKDAKGGFYAGKYYSEMVYPALVSGNMTQGQALEQVEALTLAAQLGHGGS